MEAVERLYRLVGGDGRVEGMILHFSADRHGAEMQLHPPPHIAKEIWKRLADFIRAAKQHRESGLNFQMPSAECGTRNDSTTNDTDDCGMYRERARARKWNWPEWLSGIRKGILLFPAWVTSA